jgi:hypothetical protein
MRTTTVQMDPQPTDRPVGVRSLPHWRAVLLSKPRARPPLLAAKGKTPIDLGRTYSSLRPRRSLKGSLFHRVCSLIQSLGKLSGNLGCCVALAREIYQKRSKIRIFPDLFPIGGELGRVCHGGGRVATLSGLPRSSCFVLFVRRSPDAAARRSCSRTLRLAFGAAA